MFIQSESEAGLVVVEEHREDDGVEDEVDGDAHVNSGLQPPIEWG